MFISFKVSNSLAVMKCYLQKAILLMLSNPQVPPFDRQLAGRYLQPSEQEILSSPGGILWQVYPWLHNVMSAYISQTSPVACCWAAGKSIWIILNNRDNDNISRHAFCLHIFLVCVISASLKDWKTSSRLELYHVRPNFILQLISVKIWKLKVFVYTCRKSI